MFDKRDQPIESGEPMVYQIRLKGQLGRPWADWFDGLTITLDGQGNTLLTGLVIDQAALHGLLRKVRDLGMPLLAVICLDSSSQANAAVEQEIVSSDKEQ